MANSKTTDVLTRLGDERSGNNQTRFVSVLFETEPGMAGQAAKTPDYFTDLNLDQIVTAITSGKAEYDLVPLFQAPLPTSKAIAYRHEVMRDLENAEVYATIDGFSARMHAIRAQLAGAAERRNPRQKQRWFLDAARLYVTALEELADCAPKLSLRSRGLGSVRDYLLAYVRGPDFSALKQESQKLDADLGTIQYWMHISEGSIRVRKYEGAPDYSAEVLDHFERFRQGDVKIEEKAVSPSPDMNHVEAAVLEMVAKLYPDIFAALADFVATHRDFLDSSVVRFDREIQFYMSALAFRRRFEAAGLDFCYPQIERGDKAIMSEDGFDLALADKLVGAGAPVVCNGFQLEQRERIIVVSGPNQGGKTTFARAFGQLHFLASLGLPVPGKTATLYLFDQLFTHFEREENIADRRGKLQDDLVRIHEILAEATSDSLIIMNEIFTSTALEDALFLSKKVLGQIIELDALGVCVTFIDELSTLAPQTISMVSTVVPDNPAERTYKVVRKPADGKAYALAIAEKYRLTYENLFQRFGS